MYDLMADGWFGIRYSKGSALFFKDHVVQWNGAYDYFSKATVCLEEGTYQPEACNDVNPEQVFWKIAGTGVCGSGLESCPAHVANCTTGTLVVTVPEGQLCVEYEVEMYDLWSDGWENGALHFKDQAVSLIGSDGYSTTTTVCLKDGFYQPQQCGEWYPEEVFWKIAGTGVCGSGHESCPAPDGDCTTDTLVVTVPEGQLCVEYEVEMYDLWADGWQSGALHFKDHEVRWVGSFDYYTSATVCLEEGTYQPQACSDSYPEEVFWKVAGTGVCGGGHESCPAPDGDCTTDTLVVTVPEGQLCVEYEVEMYDLWSDGWEGSALHFKDQAVLWIGSNDFYTTTTVCLEDGFYQPQQCGDLYPEEVFWKIAGTGVCGGGHILCLAPDADCTTDTLHVTVPEGQDCVEYEVEMYDAKADGWQGFALHFDFRHRVSWAGSNDYFSKATVCLSEGTHRPLACGNHNGYYSSEEVFWKVPGTGVCGGGFSFCENDAEGWSDHCADFLEVTVPEGHDCVEYEVEMFDMLSDGWEGTLNFKGHQLSPNGYAYYFTATVCLEDGFYQPQQCRERWSSEVFWNVVGTGVCGGGQDLCPAPDDDCATDTLVVTVPEGQLCVEYEVEMYNLWWDGWEGGALHFKDHQVQWIRQLLHNGNGLPGRWLVSTTGVRRLVARGGFLEDLRNRRVRHRL